MSLSLEKEKSKLIQEKCQTILTDLLKDDDNKYCVDCDAKSKFSQIGLIFLLFYLYNTLNYFAILLTSVLLMK